MYCTAHTGYLPRVRQFRIKEVFTFSCNVFL